MPVSGLFVTTHVLIAVEFYISKVYATCANDLCDDFFSVFIAWDAEDTCFFHMLVLQEHRLYFKSADFESTFLDYVLGQSSHYAVAVGSIKRCLCGAVSGFEPALPTLVSEE